MKKIIWMLRAHAVAHLDLKIILGFFGVLVPLLIFNYSLNFEDAYIDTEPNLFLRSLWMWLYHAAPYLLICFILYRSGRAQAWLKNPKFWLLFVVGFSLLAFDRSWSLWPLLQNAFGQEDRRFLYEIITKGKAIITVILPLFLFYVIAEREKTKNYYGLAIRKFDARPYFMILAIASIFIFIAGFFRDIQAYYPIYQRSAGDVFAMHHQLPEWVAVALFELPYGFDFISTELLFRGFFVIGMARVLGPYAVLPMVMSYCILHFGKPLTEALSSIVGGYILGVIALNHKNIWGGVIIHVGVAWMMEIVGYLWQIF